MIHHPRWIKKKYSTCFQIIVIWDLCTRWNDIWKKVPNIIQRINDYTAENKYDLKKMFNMFSNNIYLTHLMIKCLNQDIIVEGIIVSKKN
jgi:hypothetical protein